MKKKYVLVFLLFGIACLGFGQPNFQKLSYPNSVNLFDKFEVSFTLLESYSNPYDSCIISIVATFFSPDNKTYKVNAFYFEDYTFQNYNGYEVVTDSLKHIGWKIRFTPNQVGTWGFRIDATDENGSSCQPIIGPNNFTFVCNAVNKADGFISMANARFLKRDVVRNGQRQFHSFFPIGPNVPWYRCLDYCHFKEPRGIYYYEEHIDSLYNNANYMRIWVNTFQYLSLFGPEFTHNGTVYFDSIVNQKDSAELDHIITYASQHDVAIMFNIFNAASFRTNEEDHCDYNIWARNPYNTILHLSEPCDFFSDAEAIRITKNLIRYIISRWGYATNVMCWELWNEVDHARQLCTEIDGFTQDVLDWHDEMTSYIRNNDPFDHCISSSVGNPDLPLFSDIYQNLDIVQLHIYQNIQRANSKFDLPNSLFIRTVYGHNNYPAKPFFMGEFGFSHSRPPLSEEKDPKGIALHNSLWSSLFSASIGPASLWWCYYIDSCALYNRFTPIRNFCQNLTIPSGTFSPNSTGHNDGYSFVFPNSFETFYMVNVDEDTIMGWCQDTAFAYQSLRWKTDSIRMNYDTLYNGDTVVVYYFVDSVPPIDPNGYLYTLDPLKRPGPSSNSNLITLPITNQPVGKSYELRWYDSETGYPFNMTEHGIPVQQDEQGNKFISFEFPLFIRNLKQHTINNTFGDAVFILLREENNPSQKSSF